MSAPTMPNAWPGLARPYSKSRALAAKTASHEEALSGYEDWECMVRYVVDGGEVSITAVDMGGAWVDPADYLLPSLIRVMESGIAADLAGERAEADAESELRAWAAKGM